MERRVGIYSGTFDPVHQGHIAFAREALRACDLDEVVFLPEPRPRGKQRVTDVAHRAAMIERTIEGIAGLHVLGLTSEQFTVRDTLPELRAAFGNARLTFLVGSDVARTFAYRWDGLDTLLAEAEFAIGMRTGDDPAEITTIMAELERSYGVPARYLCIEALQADAASSKIRSGQTLADVHPATLDYIREHGLYMPNAG